MHHYRLMYRCHLSIPRVFQCVSDAALLCITYFVILFKKLRMAILRYLIHLSVSHHTK